MQKNLEKINILAGSLNLKNLDKVEPNKIFNNEVINFFDKLSSIILNSAEIRKFPDVATFAFYCRKANLNRIKNNNYNNCENLFGRGLSFHIAPSNVPINFAYSLLMGLLSGNYCIIRVSKKKFIQANYLINAINKVLELPEHDQLRKFISILEYDREKDINDFFSINCDIRIIWGGDSTINEIRKSPLKPRSFDLTFADRYSACTINAKTYINSEDYLAVAEKFYNDTYIFDQNACSSPRLVYWVGSSDNISKAQKLFWHNLHQVIKKKDYKIESSTVISKYITSCKAAFENNNCKIIPVVDNRLVRIKLNSLNVDLNSYACGGGSYIEYESEDLHHLITIINKKFQTLTYIGFKKDDIYQLFIEKVSTGLDRIVENGQAGEFNLIWDGYDTIRYLSRSIE